jgi:apolipoprotein N-acyltransferase
MAVFRAVENRTPLLRAAQSGVSAIVNADGRIAGETPLFVTTTLHGGFVPRQGPPTLYSLYWWLCQWMFVLSAAGMVAWGWRRAAGIGKYEW